MQSVYEVHLHNVWYCSLIRQLHTYMSSDLVTLYIVLLIVGHSFASTDCAGTSAVHASSYY